jgi:hypothetical protein
MPWLCCGCLFEGVSSSTRWLFVGSFGYSVGQAEPKSSLLVGPKQALVANCCDFTHQCSTCVAMSGAIPDYLCMTTILCV